MCELSPPVTAIWKRWRRPGSFARIFLPAQCRFALFAAAAGKTRGHCALLDHFLRLKAQEHSIAPKSSVSGGGRFFYHVLWPGNIRELENLIERLTILTPHETIMLRDLPVGMRSTDQTATLKEDV